MRVKRVFVSSGKGIELSEALKTTFVSAAHDDEAISRNLDAADESFGSAAS